MKTPLLLVLALTLVQVMRAQDPEASTKLNAALQNWRSLTPEVLRQPENAGLVGELRNAAISKKDSVAIVLMIELDDIGVISKCLQDLRSNDFRGRNHAMRQLGAAANPLVISMLANGLQQEESEKEILEDDVGMPRLSMAATYIIYTTIMNSSAFKPEVKSWLKAIDPGTVDVRETMRAWWKYNKAALTCKDYGSVVPLK